MRRAAHPLTEVAEREGHPAGAREVEVVHRLHVQVRLRGVARVAALRQRLAGRHGRPGADAQGAAPQVHQSDVRAAARGGEDHAVAGHGIRPRPHPRRLSEHVGQEGQLRAAAGMVGLAVVHGDDHAVGRCEDRAAEGEEALGRLAGQRGAPVAARGRPSALVDRHEIDGEALAHQVGPVARHPPGRAVLRQPAAVEGQRERNHQAPSG